MGSAKERMHEMAEENRDRKLADVLGITYDELIQTDFEITEDEGEGSNEGVVYGTLVTFSDSSPKEILKKIKGLDNANTVKLDVFDWNSGDVED